MAAPAASSGTRYPYRSATRPAGIDSAAEHSGPTETRSPIETSVVWNARAAAEVTEANEIHRTWLEATSAT